ncbi:MAG TPA: ABC transporter substrate-binding protein [Acidobacteriaceae bacterium]
MTARRILAREMQHLRAFVLLKGTASAVPLYSQNRVAALAAEVIVLRTQTLLTVFLTLCLCFATSCRTPPPPPGTIVILLESSPNNLDLRQGTDAQSERVGALLFDPLVKKDAHFNLQPWLATSWDHPDPLTWIFHLRDGVRFHDGRPLEAADVAWTIQSLTDPALTAHLPGGTLLSAKASSFAGIAHIDTPDRLIVVLHLSRPDPALLFNLSDGLFGVVPRNSGAGLGLHPIGSGPYRFLSQTQDKEVVLERAPNCWSGTAPYASLQFNVVPDAVTSALELQKGSADAASNVLTPDMTYSLRNSHTVQISDTPGSNIWYLNFNTADPTLADRRIRQSIAYAIDRPAIVASIWRNQAQLATGTLLPSNSWAATSPADLMQYPHDPARAIALLESAGLHPDAHGIRLRVNIKISTGEQERLLAAALQQQLREAGIALSIRSAEFGTFYSDVTRGAFQLYPLKWIGSNEDPDIFRYLYSSASLPPRGANRGHYINPRIDALLAQAAAESGPDAQTRRRADYIAIQKILAIDLPTIPLWFPSSTLVHSARLPHATANPSGNFDFLR